MTERDLLVVVPTGLYDDTIEYARRIHQGQHGDIISIPYIVGRWVVLEKNTWHATGSTTRRGRASLVDDLKERHPQSASRLQEVVSAGKLTDDHLIGALYGIAKQLLTSEKSDFSYYRTHAKHGVEEAELNVRRKNIKKKIVETDQLWQSIEPERVFRLLAESIPDLKTTWPCEMHALDQRGTTYSKFTAHTDAFMDARPVYRSCVIEVADEIKLVVFAASGRGKRKLMAVRP